jgi:uncharacterized phage protein gp47/JayE
MIEAVANQVFKIHNRQRRIMSRPFWHTASGTDLDDIALGFKISRLASTRSNGKVTFYRTNTSQPVLIPAGTRVSKPSSGQNAEVFYTTKADLYMNIGDSMQDVDIEAELSGVSGNTGPRTIVKVSVLNITGCYNANEISNAQDIETDDHLRRRISLLFSAMQKATIDALKYAAFSVPGVESVAISQNNPSAGMIKIFTSDANGVQSVTQRDLVTKACDEYKAAGITINVAAASLKYESIFATVVVSKSEDIQLLKEELEYDLVIWLNSYTMGQPLIRSEVISRMQDNTRTKYVKSLLMSGSGINIINTRIDEMIRPSSVTISVELE